MSDVREGGCSCGKLRYRVRGEALLLAVCHCTECQTQSGSAFGMSLIVAQESFELLEGELGEAVRGADSGRQMAFRFCRDCGTRIYHIPAYREGVFNLKAGTLDDTRDLVPAMHVWTASKQPWVEIPQGVKAFEGQPF